MRFLRSPSRTYEAPDGLATGGEIDSSSSP